MLRWSELPITDVSSLYASSNSVQFPQLFYPYDIWTFFFGLISLKNPDEDKVMQNWCTLFTSSYVVRALFKPEKELTTHSNCPETEQKEFCLWKALASFTVCCKKSGPSLWNRDLLRYTYFPTNIPATKDLKFSGAAAIPLTTSDLLIYRLRIV